MFDLSDEGRLIPMCTRCGHARGLHRARTFHCPSTGKRLSNFDRHSVWTSPETMPSCGEWIEQLRQTLGNDRMVAAAECFFRTSQAAELGAH